MKQCTACRRHVRPSEGQCPFCGEVLHAGEAPRLGAVVLLGALGVACTARPIDDSATGGSSGAMTTGASASTGTGAPLTTSGTSTSPGTTAVTTTTGATSTGELTSSSDVDGSDAGCAFYGCPSDVGQTTKECDPWVQDCPPGEKCMPWSADGDTSWDSLKCVPVARDPAAPGEPCMVEGSGVSGLDNCELGAMCWGVDDRTMMGTCVAMCTGAPEEPVCADPKTSCVIANDSVLTLCLPNCNPLMQECPDGQVCISNPSDPQSFLCVVDASGAEGQEFDPCEFVNDCDPGFLCADSGLAAECDPQVAAGCCLPFCDVTMPMCDGQGAECLPWFEMGQAPMGLENLGICGIPQ